MAMFVGIVTETRTKSMSIQAQNKREAQELFEERYANGEFTFDDLDQKDMFTELIRVSPSCRIDRY